MSQKGRRLPEDAKTIIHGIGNEQVCYFRQKKNFLISISCVSELHLTGLFYVVQWTALRLLGGSV